MTGRILPLHSSEHAAVDALLPWFVNGTLRGEELALVERHLGTCEQCRLEIDWLRKVFAGCAVLAEMPETPPAVIARLAAIGQAAQSPSWRKRVAGSWHSAEPWVRGLLAAQLAAVVLLGTLLATGALHDANYRTLGAPQPAATARQTIAVIFDPAVTEGEMQRIVAAVGARIVGGPTTTNAFVLEVPDQRADGAVQTLRAERWVRYAEPLTARSEPR